MIGSIVRLFGSRAAHKAMAKHAGDGGLLDIKLGFALLRDRRVPLLTKFLALGLGGIVAALLINLELPLEAVLAVFLPFFGVVLDGLVDGLEAFIGPVILGALLLPHLAPKPIVAQIRAERAALAGGTIIDVESVAVPVQETPPQPQMLRHI